MTPATSKRWAAGIAVTHYRATSSASMPGDVVGPASSLFPRPSALLSTHQHHITESNQQDCRHDEPRRSNPNWPVVGFEGVGIAVETRCDGSRAGTATGQHLNRLKR